MSRDTYRNGFKPFDIPYKGHCTTDDRTVRTVITTKGNSPGSKDRWVRCKVCNQPVKCESVKNESDP